MTLTLTMIYSKAAVAAAFLAGSASAFLPQSPLAFAPATTAGSVEPDHLFGSSAWFGAAAQKCACPDCRRSSGLHSTTEAAAPDEVPAEVAALDGIESEDEAHNVDRPARQSLKKKGPRGKPLSEFSVGDTVSAKVKTITNYGAFVDIGATSDGLLHISQLSVDFVSDVSSVVEAGQDVEVRIISIDEGKNQVALSLLTADEEESAKEAANRSRQPRQQRTRRDDGAVLSQLVEKGWSAEQFVEGTVVSTVDFGAFVRVDASQLQDGVEGTFDGLVHISALAAGRVDAVSSIVSVDDKVQVRVKGIADRKVSLSMVSPEEEAKKMESRGGGGGGGQFEGAKDWKESLAKLQDSMPEFKNRPLVVDLRK